MHDEIIEAILRYIDDHIDGDINIDVIAAKSGYSASYFSRMFSDTLGITPSAYVTWRKLQFALQDISGGAKIVDTAIKYGFETHWGFTKAFRKCFGYPPSAAVDGGYKYDPCDVNIRTLSRVHKRNGGTTMHIDSRVVRGHLGYDPHTGAISFPIYQTSTYRHKSAEDMSGYDYTRCQNPTREELEHTIAILESGRYGFAFTTGLAANLAVFSLLSSGDHAIVSDDIYGGTYRLIENIFKRYNVDFTYCDPSDLDGLTAAVRPNTKLFFIETPTNPMSKVADIAKIAQIAHDCNALLAVDNTFLTPYFQRPLEHGADIVIHSGTKFLGGHHDTMAGMAVMRDEVLADQFRNFIKTEGSGLSPFDSWLMLRGIKTLALRMERHQSNAIAVADWLGRHPKVDKIYFAGLPSHAGYDISCRQATGFGGMISFSLRDPATARQVLRNVKFILFAESLGGTETLITYPMTQTHASIPADIREKLGITDRLLRLSVGVENPDDIIADLEQALW